MIGLNGLDFGVMDWIVDHGAFLSFFAFLCFSFLFSSLFSFSCLGIWDFHFLLMIYSSLYSTFALYNGVLSQLAACRSAQAVPLISL